MTKELNDRQTRIFLEFLVALSSLSIGLYSPSLSHITQQFGTQIGCVQLSMVFFMLGFALSRLFFGPMSDHKGRNYSLYIGLGLFLASSIGCTLVSNVFLLIAGRFFQGLGIGCINMIAYAILRDRFTGDELDQNLLKLSNFAYFMILLAPLFGAYVEHELSWEFGFWFLFVYGMLLIFYVFFTLPETNPQNETAEVNLCNLKNYMQVIDRKFIAYTLCTGFVISIPIVLLTLLPFLLIDTLKTHMILYGFLFTILATGYMFGAYFNKCLHKKFSAARIIYLGNLVMIAMSALALLLGSMEQLDLISIGAPLFFVLIGAGLVFPNTYNKSVIEYTSNTSLRSAVFGFTVSICGAIAALICIPLQHADQIPVAIFCLVLAAATLVVYWLGVPND